VRERVSEREKERKQKGPAVGHIQLSSDLFMALEQGKTGN